MRFLRKLICVLSVLLFNVGYSAWLATTYFQTENMMNDTNNDKAKVNVYFVKNSVAQKPVYEYYIPDQVTVNESKFLKSTGTKEKIGEVGNGYKTINYDEQTIYQNIDENGKALSTITRHNASLGPEQIKHKDITVNSWKKVESDTTWGDVWNVKFGDDVFYFFSNCDNNFRFQQKYKVGDLLPNTSIELSKHTYIDETTHTQITEQVLERAVVKTINEIEVGQKHLIQKYVWGRYNPVYQYRKVVTKQVLSSSSVEKANTDVRVTKGTKLNAVDLKVENFEKCGVYTDSSCSTLFDFSKPVYSDTDIFIRYNQVSNESSTLANQISSLSSGNTIDVFDAGRGGTSGEKSTAYDLSSDPIYNNSGKIGFLNGVTVKSGTTVNLTYDSAKVYEEPINDMISSGFGSHRSGNDNIAYDYQNGTYIGLNNCNTYIALNGDLTINGTVTVGGHIGSLSSRARYSYLIGHYSCLDLYGHDIYVDGGTLNGYGVIKDSIGTGKIIVKNKGKIESTLTVSDGRDVEKSILALSKRQSPFTEYRFSYLNVPIRFYNGTTLIGYLKFDIGNYGIKNFHLNFIGSTTALFLWNDSLADSYVDYFSETIDTITDQTYLRDCYNLRNKLVFNADIIQNYNVPLDIKITIAGISASADVDFARIDFPISPFFDLLLNTGKTMSLTSKMTFYPGSSLYAQPGSTLHFKFSGSKTYSKTKGITVAGETRYLCGGIMSYSNDISTLAKQGHSSEYFNVGVYDKVNYWKAFKTGNITLDGTMVFDSISRSGVNSSYINDCYYLLSGPINMSKQSLMQIISHRADLRTYDFKAELVGGFLFNTDNRGSDNQFLLASSYNMNPLISNGKGYIIDSTNSICGTLKNGLVVDAKNMAVNESDIVYSNNGKSYFLLTDTDMYENGSTSKTQESRIDRTITISECSMVKKELKVISSGGLNYVFYKGIYVPLKTDVSSIDSNSIITINARKFMSNKDTDKNTDAAKYDNVNVKFNKTNSNWCYSSFM